MSETAEPICGPRCPCTPQLHRSRAGEEVPQALHRRHRTREDGDSSNPGLRRRACRRSHETAEWRTAFGPRLPLPTNLHVQKMGLGTECRNADDGHVGDKPLMGLGTGINWGRGQWLRPQAWNPFPLAVPGPMCHRHQRQNRIRRRAGRRNGGSLQNAAPTPSPRTRETVRARRTHGATVGVVG